MDLEELKRRLIDSAENWLNEVDTRKEAVAAIEQLQRELEETRRDAERTDDEILAAAEMYYVPYEGYVLNSEQLIALVRQQKG